MTASCSPLRSLWPLGLAGLLAALGCHSEDYSPRTKPGEIDIYDDLFAVSVPDELHAVAVGYHGAAYWTEDGGERWFKGATNSKELLYSVSMADLVNGWAVGQTGTILHTKDGGKTWQQQPNLKVDEGSHLFGVQALDANTAWAVGEWGTRIHTEDGGATWTDESLTIDVSHPMFVWLTVQDQERVRKNEKVYEDVGLNNIFCLPAPSQKCWTVGEFGYIFWSDDRGASWNRSEILGAVRIEPIVFGYNQIEIADADADRLREFAAQIVDFAHLNVLIDVFATGREIAELGQKDDPSGLFDVLSARLDETKSILEDAGVMSDRLRMPNKPPWDFEDFLDDDPTFLDRYLEGRKADQPAVRVSVIQNPYLFTIRFKDEENGLISGLGGVVLRSQDGGKTWNYESTGRKQALFSVAAVDGRAIAVGEKGFVRVSADGGASWAAPDEGSFPTVFTFMRDIGFDKLHRTGLIVGQQGKILRSKDQGATWTVVLPPPEADSGGRLF
jgi:photosystem II stability/assembly factor-like uncharacterized protein